MSWWSEVSRWFSPSRGTGESFDNSVESDCSDEELGGLRRELEVEQRSLSREIEGLFKVYDVRLQGLSTRLRGMDDDQIRRESATIRGAQDELRRLIRRFQASMKSRQDLERELAEWSERHDSSAFRADHPRVRAEIARSELAGRDPATFLRPTQVPEKRMPVVQQIVVSSDENLDEMESPQPVRMSRPAEPLPRINVEHLLQAIKDATREAELWHAQPSSLHDSEVLDQLHHVRDLHAVLKRLDRQQGMKRDRLVLAISPRELH